MRYAIFTDIHANLEALEAVLAKIDELAQEEPIDQIWFLGDLVGYGPNPNECIVKLRERTNVIIAGNHDWAAVGKIDLEDFSEAARVSAQWTAQQLTEEHREFLSNLPERIEMEDCVLVHGSPYGPLWEYLTSEVLAERSFQYFNTRYCIVGHTHVPIIFQQYDDTIAHVPTIPLANAEADHPEAFSYETTEGHLNGGVASNENEMVAVRPGFQTTAAANQEEAPHPETLQVAANIADKVAEAQQISADDAPDMLDTHEDARDADKATSEESTETPLTSTTEAAGIEAEDTQETAEDMPSTEAETSSDEDTADEESDEQIAEITPEETIVNAEERLNEEIEELLALLGLSQSMVNVTNEMIIPPEGEWQAPESYRAIINPGGVGQPRDGDPRAAFMIYDTERGFTFYRVPYGYEKTQEKISKAGLPPYLATRLAYGR